MSIFTKIGQGIASLFPGSTVTYEAAKKPVFVPAKTIVGVPPEYMTTLQEAAKHTGIPVEQLAAQFKAENGGKWDPKLKGRRDPTDFGVTQLNPATGVATITGKNGGHNYFKENYGHEFDPSNPHDQILGSGVYLNYLKQTLPKFGVNNPTNQDVMMSYNLGAKGYAKAKAGDAGYVPRMRQYQELLANNGVTF